MHNINVLIADDSGLMRLLIKNILEEDEQLTVLGSAKDGREAVAMCSDLNPDVVVMDMTMPVYDGKYAIERIMKKCPKPIVILSALGNTNMEPIMEALRLGALDYVNKPQQNKAKVRDVKDKIISKIKHAAGENVNLESKKITGSVNLNPHAFSDTLAYDIVVIGASTGGPTAVETVISNLPSNMAVPVVIGQHMPANFVPSFARRLNSISPLQIVEAQKDDTLFPGKVYIAPGGKNMILQRKSHGVTIGFTTRKYAEYNNPSINAIMESAAMIYGARTIGAILTGMGRDGVKGLKAIKTMGGFTIAQDQRTSVVYGMPGEAKKQGAAQAIVPIQEIGGFIVSCLS